MTSRNKSACRAVKNGVTGERGRCDTSGNSNRVRAYKPRAHLSMSVFKEHDMRGIAGGITAGIDRRRRPSNRWAVKCRPACENERQS